MVTGVGAALILGGTVRLGVGIAAMPSGTDRRAGGGSVIHRRHVLKHLRQEGEVDALGVVEAPNGGAGPRKLGKLGNRE